MKTTIDIADALLEQARRHAQQQGTTVRALVEMGLRKVIEEAPQTQGFRLRKVTCKGRGLQPDLVDASWERLREMAYDGRGT